eukprot:6491547-Amphidinium_carterae.2
METSSRQHCPRKKLHPQLHPLASPACLSWSATTGKCNLFLACGALRPGRLGSLSRSDSGAYSPTHNSATSLRCSGSSAESAIMLWLTQHAHTTCNANASFWN